LPALWGQQQDFSNQKVAVFTYFALLLDHSFYKNTKTENLQIPLEIRQLSRTFILSKAESIFPRLKSIFAQHNY
jgi:hypothetical protein